MDIVDKLQSQKRCAECDCENGGDDCNWIKPAPMTPAVAAFIREYQRSRGHEESLPATKTRDPYDDHEAENDALEAMRKRGEWDYTPKPLDASQLVYAKGLRDALVAIADLPTGRSEDMMEGQEQAYRAVEALALAMKENKT